MSLDHLLEMDAHLTGRLRTIEQHRWLRLVAILLAHSGDSWYCLAALGLLWLFGGLFWKNLAVTMAVALILTAVIVFVIKFSVRRKRPSGEWGGFYRMTDPHSFPSGHAARTVLLAVIAVGLGPAWLGIIMLLWAPLVALARAAMGVHYLSDVIAGMLIGLLMGWLSLGLYWAGGAESLARLVSSG